MTSPITSRHSIVPLESYRLAQYMKPIACFICGEGNTFDSELCHLCHAPMALAHQANDQQVEPQMIAVIGAAGAGKTVYLGMLTDMLSSCNSELQLLARGAFSISLQQATIAALARCDFPDKTPNEPDRWNWMHYQAMMSNRRHPLEIMIPDMAGEALLEEINHPHSYPVIRAFLSKCTGALLLIDAGRLENGDRGHDLTGMKILSYLRELNEQRQRKDQNYPLAIVFTKADECNTCFDSPPAFAERYAAGVWGHCQQRWDRCRFFAAGVVGSCGVRRDWNTFVRVPLRVEPRGVTEPFLWLLKQFEDRRSRQRRKKS